MPILVHVIAADMFEKDLNGLVEKAAIRAGMKRVYAEHGETEYRKKTSDSDDEEGRGEERSEEAVESDEQEDYEVD